MKSSTHLPVMLKEALAGLDVKKGAQYIDATLGDGGHAIEIIKQGGRLLGIDCDPEQIKRAEQRLLFTFPQLAENADAGEQSGNPPYKPKLVCANFVRLEGLAWENGFTATQGILFDLGVSSPQLESETRGLSFREDFPLDMRLDPKLKITAKELVNSLGEKELYEIFIRNVQEELARPIARAIIGARNLKPFETTKELAQVIAAVKQPRGGKIHPATKTFLALRMEVNREIENLNQGIDSALEILNEKGRLVVIGFHETEDRLVKQKFKKAKNLGKIKIITKKPLMPTSAEIKENPKARSAKLRIIEKLC